MSSFTVEANRFQTPTPDHLEAGRVVIAVVDGEITAVERPKPRQRGHSLRRHPITGCSATTRC